MKRVLVVVVCLLVAACGKDRRAVLSEAHGLAEDSPVYVSGVQVGSVDSVRVTERGVEVVFQIESQHDVRFRADACVLAGDLHGTPALIVIPGRQGEPDDSRALPQCRLPADELAQALQGFAGVLQGTLEQMLRAWANPTPMWPQPPPPPTTLPFAPAPPAVPAPPAPAPVPAPVPPGP